MRAAGASPQELAESQKSMEMMMGMVKNPIGLFFLTLIEPLPVGILLTLISAAIVRKKTPAQTAGVQ